MVNKEAEAKEKETDSLHATIREEITAVATPPQQLRISPTLDRQAEEIDASANRQAEDPPMEMMTHLHPYLTTHRTMTSRKGADISTPTNAL